MTPTLTLLLQRLMRSSSFHLMRQNYAAVGAGEYKAAILTEETLPHKFIKSHLYLVGIYEGNGGIPVGWTV